MAIGTIIQQGGSLGTKKALARRTAAIIIIVKCFVGDWKINYTRYDVIF